MNRELILQKPSIDEVIKQLRDIVDLGYRPFVTGLHADKVALVANDAIEIIEKLRAEIEELKNSRSPCR